MSRLSDLRAVVDGNDRCLTVECRECDEAECPCDVLHDMLFPADGTTPTIRALLDVAEAAEQRRIEEEREYSMTEPLPSPEWEAAEAALEAALDALVKEADDE